MLCRAICNHDHLSTVRAIPYAAMRSNL
jgi:hypothetical protein